MHLRGSFCREISGSRGVQGCRVQWPLARWGFIVHLDNYVHHCQITFLSHVTPKIHSFPFELAIFFQSFPWPSFSSIGIHLTTMFTFSNTLFRQFYMFLALPVMNLAAPKFIFQIYSYSLTPGPNPQIFYSLLAI